MERSWGAYAVVMPESVQTVRPKSAGSFADFLASFTGGSDKSDDDWDLSGLAEDVATINYEQALRSHRAAHAAEFATERLRDKPLAGAAIRGALQHAAGSKKKSKTSSITLRLTEEEHGQLHERAAAAKLSTSAYIRSCIFEAESLRTQVREALAQMQAASPSATASPPDEKPSRWHQRFFAHWPRRRGD
jgi:hypothetical protein